MILLNNKKYNNIIEIKKEIEEKIDNNVELIKRFNKIDLYINGNYIQTFYDKL